MVEQVLQVPLQVAEEQLVPQVKVMQGVVLLQVELEEEVEQVVQVQILQNIQQVQQV